ncbi:hypothetical protein H696_00078 [Fonticula alba]|uniref:ADF-H domain-containing protein n=1 Tax=Fonticula alba TaxID=691883 RepID=A0A058ZEY4_FONAL|nr:hypothetical protein H696_00078 [Fonticula alba]KCV72483.1 hypothetical protein H696_00078 [Fonticula alba]|eukprot:XP_009492184.1 hypothetical protein H696_00078 [Fonticula alba]
MSLDTSCPTILEAYHAVRKGEQDWLVLGYQGQRNKISALGTGRGIDAFVEQLGAELITFGYVTAPSTPGKYVMVGRISEEARGLQKSKARTHRHTLTDLMPFFHAEMDIDDPLTVSKDSLDEAVENSTKPAPAQDLDEEVLGGGGGAATVAAPAPEDTPAPVAAAEPATEKPVVADAAPAATKEPEPEPEPTPAAAVAPAVEEPTTPAGVTIEIFQPVADAEDDSEEARLAARVLARNQRRARLAETTAALIGDEPVVEEDKPAVSIDVEPEAEKTPVAAASPDLQPEAASPVQQQEPESEASAAASPVAQEEAAAVAATDAEEEAAVAEQPAASASADTSAEEADSHPSSPADAKTLIFSDPELGDVELTEEQLAELMDDLGLYEPPSVTKAPKMNLTAEEAAMMHGVRNASVDRAAAAAAATAGSSASAGSPKLAEAQAAADEATTAARAEIDRIVTLVEQDSPDIRDLNMNHAEHIDQAVMDRLGAALATNTRVKTISLCNVNLRCSMVKPLAEGLALNKHAEVLNLETNAIGPEGLEHIAAMLAVNESLTELRLVNQRIPSSQRAERSMIKALENNKFIQRLGMNFRDNNARQTSDKYVFRNKDLARQRRVAAAKAAAGN